jgi:cytochrome c oxidase assembly protein subunit 15
MIDRMDRLTRFAWGTLAYNVAVILWGAYVRASGSGAGCGSHWPFCNGEVLPLAPDTAMLIEFSHRITSGIALIAVVVLLVWIWRTRPAGDPARMGAVLGVFFMLTEAAVGAGLVLFRLVADNATMARAMFMAVHLVNTFLLLAALTLTAWWVSGGERLQLSAQRGRLWGAIAGAVAILIVGTSGAVAALGDTLFPSSSLSGALAQDLSATSHLLIRLRVFHPVLAAATVLALVAGAPKLARGDARSRRAARAVIALAALQVAAGFANVFLLAPIWLQLLHLLIADALWIAFVLLGATALSSPVSGSPLPASRKPASL